MASKKPLTSWHFENRAAKNIDLPPSAEAAEQAGWDELPPELAIFHQNGGAPDLKFVNPDGREVVYDGDTGTIITDPRWAGTYNYVNAAEVPTNSLNVFGWVRWALQGIGHVLFDVIPFKILGNVRSGNG